MGGILLQQLVLQQLCTAQHLIFEKPLQFDPQEAEVQMSKLHSAVLLFKHHRE